MPKSAWRAHVWRLARVAQEWRARRPSNGQAPSSLGVDAMVRLRIRAIEALLQLADWLARDDVYALLVVDSTDRGAPRATRKVWWNRQRE